MSRYTYRATRAQGRACGSGVKAVLGAMVVGAMLLCESAIAAPLAGAIFTTDATCTGVDLNIYASKDTVYLSGGPASPNAQQIPDGSYYVKVTEPNGTLLGTSVGSANEQPFVVLNGVIQGCYQLSAILIKASDATPGYDTTSNAGGVYKAWISTVASFVNDSSKTDNFKVNSTTPEPDKTATLVVRKFYDASTTCNNSGAPYFGETAGLLGWKVNVIDMDKLTKAIYDNLPLDTYQVNEYKPLENTPTKTVWYSTCPQPVSPSDPSLFLNSTSATLANAGDTVTVEFGNVCVGAGGGLTLGFWSNKNGAALFTPADLAALVALNLRDGSGANFDPASYAAFRTWLLNATATNMAYMLSAQMSAMTLNVAHGFVSGSALIYAPGATSANPAGFATVSAVLGEANASLGANGLVLSGNPVRTYQEALKNALDNANNNLNFVQATPCAFSFSSN